MSPLPPHLRALVTEARARWPAVRVDDERLAAYLAERVAVTGTSGASGAADAADAEDPAARQPVDA